jgi:hypothetical protein
MDVVLVLLGWLLAWALGVAVLLALRARSASLRDAGELAYVVGCGFLVGQFLLTLEMRLLALAGIAFGRAAIAAPIAAATAIALWLAVRRHDGSLVDEARAAVRTFEAPELPRWQRVLWFGVLGWLAIRFGLLLLEVLRRPLFPWDAWTQWATKARVWYELRALVPFTGAAEWLAAPSGSVYLDAAPHYPATIPLTQVWSALVLGRFDDALINLPWWLTGVAFGFALYALLREAQFGRLGAIIGTWLVLSMPIVDAHVALAGYADLAMAAYFTLTAFAWLRFVRTRGGGDLALALLLASACVLVKNPGKLWLAMLVPGIVAAWLPRRGLRFAAACFAVAAVAALVLTRSGVTLLGYHLQLDFDMPWGGLMRAYFAFANWHLLFYAASALPALGWRHLLARELAPLTLVVAAGFAFLLFGFAFTNARVWVEDQSTVNRATLHLAPLIAIWTLMVFRAWARSQASAARGGTAGEAAAA